MSQLGIAILGGGMAGLTTALALTEDPQWQAKLGPITVYQMGWRLGGKCATGRGPNGRVQEHGIHLFSGGYFNALPMFRKVYGDLAGGAGGWHVPVGEAFEPQWVNVTVPSAGAPTGAEGPLAPLPVDEQRRLGEPRYWLKRMLRVGRALLFNRVDLSAAALTGGGGLVETLETLGTLGPLVSPDAWDPSRLFGAWSLSSLTSAPMAIQAHLLIDRAIAMLDACDDVRFELAVADFMAWVDRAEALDASAKQLAGLSGLSGAWATIRYFGVIIGATQIDLLRHRLSFNDLDALNYDEWLLSHRLSKTHLSSAIALSPLRILYQWPEGRVKLPGSMGAGTYLHWVLRQFAYIDAPFWFFPHGSGESLVLPMFELLRRRGVRFEFFHKVSKVVPRGGKVEVEIGIQARMKDPLKPYDPLVELRPGYPVWPAAPKFELLDAGKWPQGAPSADEFESDWPGTESGAIDNKTLIEGRDFDQLVFAISLGAIPHLCAEIVAADKRWRAMVDHVKTVETQSLQLWLNKTSAGLGLDIKSILGKAPRDADDTGLGCGFASPHDGFKDFTPLIDVESWTSGAEPKALWYFSDVIAADPAEKPDPGYPQRRQEAARLQALTFIDGDLGQLLPGVSHSGRFDDRLLVPPATSGAPRLSSQWVRANVQPSERYVQAPHNTTQHRLAPWESGIAGVVLAGDWTYNGLNVGCVEAAVMSGKLAANTVQGKADKSEGVIGYFKR